MKDRFGFDWTGIKGQPFWAKPFIGRRMFFRHLASAVGGYMLLPTRPMETVAKAAVTTKNTAKNVIFIFLNGAPSHVDTFDLKEGPWTPAFMAPTTYGDLRFPQGLMPNLAERLDSLCFLRSVRAYAGVHELMQTWVQIGRNPTSAMSKISPHIGAVVSIERTDASAPLPAFIALNSNPRASSGYLPAVNAPFLVAAGNNLPNTTHRDGAARFESRYQLLQQMDAEMRSSYDIGSNAEEMASWNARARGLMYNSAIDSIFVLSTADRTRFGNSGFGNACLVARNLLKAKLGTRFIQIDFGSWDHHSNIYAANANLQSMSRQFDLGLANLITDLKEANLFDETLIIAQGEFGRTIGALNSSAGRDHFLQQSVMFAGAGIRGGRAIGATDDRGSLTSVPGWSRERDVRAEDIEATIYSAMGIDWTTIRHDDPLGRGFEYVPFADRDQYGPVHELWG